MQYQLPFAADHPSPSPDKRNTGRTSDRNKAPQPRRERGLANLREQTGWERYGANRWEFGQDPRLPRLIASRRQGQWALVMSPPVDDATAPSWDASYGWAFAMRMRGLQPDMFPVGDAYEVCGECLCPLMATTGEQTCPACGAEAHTRVISDAAKNLVAVAVVVPTEARLLITVKDVTPAFERLLSVMESRLRSPRPAPQRSHTRLRPQRDCRR